MARPQKKGLDYFPLDVTMDVTDDNVVMLEAKHGVIGFTTLIKLYMKIYQDEGYFIKWDEKSSLLLSKRVNADINLVNDIINDLVHWGVFNEDMFEKHTILTSRRIQKTYLSAVYKRKDIEMVNEYLLLEDINDNVNLVNDVIYPQRKEKKRKEEKRILNTLSEEEENPIPFKEIIDYLNLKIKGTYKHTTKKTRSYITTRWNEGFTLEDFYKAIDNTYAFRMDNGGDLTYVRPTTIFNGDFENRVNGTAFGFTEDKNEKQKYSLDQF